MRLNGNFIIEKEATCNGCANLDFKYKQCRALKEKHCVVDDTGKQICTYDVFKSLDCFTAPSSKNEGEYVTVLKAKDCKGYIPRKNKRVINDDSNNNKNKKG